MEQGNFYSMWETPAQRTLRERAAAWIEANPRVFALFEKFALAMAERERRFGIKALAETVRWSVLMEIPKDEEGYRLNNSLVAYLGRELVRRHPELEPYIEFRRCGDEKDAVTLTVVGIPNR